MPAAETKNFSLLTDPKLACSCGHVNCDRRAVKQVVLEQLQCVRDDYEKAMFITSGGRCPNHPAERGRAGTDHQDCSTVDVLCDNQLDATKLAALAARHGATKVSTWTEGDQAIHLSWRKTSRKDIPTWTYASNTSMKGKKKPSQSKTVKAASVGAGSVVTAIPIIDAIERTKTDLTGLSEALPFIQYLILGLVILSFAIIIIERVKKDDIE